MEWVNCVEGSNTEEEISYSPCAVEGLVFSCPCPGSPTASFQMSAWPP